MYRNNSYVQVLMWNENSISSTYISSYEWIIKTSKALMSHHVDWSFIMRPRNKKTNLCAKDLSFIKDVRTNSEWLKDVNLKLGYQ